MRKLLVAFAAVPAIGHAALVIEDGGQQKNGAVPLAFAKAASVTVTGPDKQKAAPSPRAPTLASVAPPAGLTVVSAWVIEPTDLSLRDALTRWARLAGWQVSWESPMDFPATLLGSFNGTFEDAATKLVTSLLGSDYPLTACFYEANKVLRVIRHVDDKDCL